MNKIKIALLISAWALSAPFAFAQTPAFSLSLSSETEPLFDISNFLPGQTLPSGEETVWIQITNHASTTENFYIQGIRVADEGDLSSKMQLEIAQNQSEFYESYNLQTFLNQGAIELGSINGDSSRSYDFRITFLTTAGNESQNKNLEFDICIGMSSGEVQCVEAVAEETPEPTNTGGGGGGFSGSRRHPIASTGSDGGFSNPIVPPAQTNFTPPTNSFPSFNEQPTITGEVLGKSEAPIISTTTATSTEGSFNGEFGADKDVANVFSGSFLLDGKNKYIFGGLLLLIIGYFIWRKTGAAV